MLPSLYNLGTILKSIFFFMSMDLCMCAEQTILSWISTWPERRASNQQSACYIGLNPSLSWRNIANVIVFFRQPREEKQYPLATSAA